MNEEVILDVSKKAPKLCEARRGGNRLDTSAWTSTGETRTVAPGLDSNQINQPRPRTGMAASVASASRA